MGSSFAQFEGEKYLSLETYRRSGAAVRTPVWFVGSGDALYVRTSEDTGKYKRIRNNPAARIAPCDMRGNLKGEWVEVSAGLASPAESTEAYRLFQPKYGALYTITRFLMRRKKYVLLKITPRSAG
jgi:hypothetical protein